MRTSRHIAGDRNIVRLVGENEPGWGIAVHQFGENRRVGGNAMLAEAKYVAGTRDRDGVGLGSKRALFDPFWLMAENDLINLFQREAGDLDRRVAECKFLQFA